MFITQYKNFNIEFEYESRPFKDWLSYNLKDIEDCKEMMFKIK